MRRTTPVRSGPLLADRYAHRPRPVICLSWLLSGSSWSPHVGRFFLGQRNGGSTEIHPGPTETIL